MPCFLNIPLLSVSTFLVQKNSEDQGTMDTLLTCMFKCAFSDKEGSAAALNDLNGLQKEEGAF